MDVQVVKTKNLLYRTANAKKIVMKIFMKIYLKIVKSVTKIVKLVQMTFYVKVVIMKNGLMQIKRVLKYVTRNFSIIIKLNLALGNVIPKTILTNYKIQNFVLFVILLELKFLEIFVFILAKINLWLNLKKVKTYYLM